MCTCDMCVITCVCVHALCVCVCVCVCVSILNMFTSVTDLGWTLVISNLSQTMCQFAHNQTQYEYAFSPGILTASLA